MEGRGAWLKSGQCFFNFVYLSHLGVSFWLGRFVRNLRICTLTSSRCCWPVDHTLPGQDSENLEMLARMPSVLEQRHQPFGHHGAPVIHTSPVGTRCSGEHKAEVRQLSPRSSICLDRKAVNKRGRWSLHVEKVPQGRPVQMPQGRPGTGAQSCCRDGLQAGGWATAAWNLCSKWEVGDSLAESEKRFKQQGWLQKCLLVQSGYFSNHLINTENLTFSYNDLPLNRQASLSQLGW